MKIFILGLMLLVPRTGYARSPCKPPPNQAVSATVRGNTETHYNTVMLSEADYARLYEWYNRCLIAWSGGSESWTRFLERTDEAERIATGNAEQMPFLQHLDDLESATKQLQISQDNTATMLERIHSLEQAILELQTQRLLLVPSQSDTPPAKTDLAAAVTVQ